MNKFSVWFSGLFFGLLSATGIWYLTDGKSSQSLRSSAVIAGVARWTAGPNGNPEFSWVQIKCPPQPIIKNAALRYKINKRGENAKADN